MHSETDSGQISHTWSVEEGAEDAAVRNMWQIFGNPERTVHTCSVPWHEFACIRIGSAA